MTDNELLKSAFILLTTPKVDVARETGIRAERLSLFKSGLPLSKRDNEKLTAWLKSRIQLIKEIEI